MLLTLHAMPVATSGDVELLVLEGADIRTLEELGIVVGSTIESTEGGFTVNGQEIQISQTLSALILILILSHSPRPYCLLTPVSCILTTIDFCNACYIKVLPEIKRIEKELAKFPA